MAAFNWLWSPRVTNADPLEAGLCQWAYVYLAISYDHEAQVMYEAGDRKKVKTHWPVSIGAEGLSAYAVQGKEELVFLFFYDGEFKNSSSSGTSNSVTGQWRDEGAILLRDGKSFGFFREPTAPDALNINGMNYNIKQGRLFVI